MTHDHSIARLATGEFVVVFPRNEQLIAAFKKVPGKAVRTQPVRHCIVQKVPAAGKALLDFAERYGFDFMPGVRMHAEWLACDSWIDLEEGWFAMYFPKDLAKNAEIKAIRGWRTSIQPVFHWLIPQSKEAMQRLQAFLVRHPKFLLRPEAKRELFAPSARHS